MSLLPLFCFVLPSPSSLDSVVGLLGWMSSLACGAELVDGGSAAVVAVVVGVLAVVADAGDGTAEAADGSFVLRPGSAVDPGAVAGASGGRGRGVSPSLVHGIRLETKLVTAEAADGRASIVPAKEAKVTITNNATISRDRRDVRAASVGTICRGATAVGASSAASRAACSSAATPP